MITLGQLLATFNGTTKAHVYVLGSRKEAFCEGTCCQIYYHLWQYAQATKDRLVRDVSIIDNELHIWII